MPQSQILNVSGTTCSTSGSIQVWDTAVKSVISPDTKKILLKWQINAIISLLCLNLGEEKKSLSIEIQPDANAKHKCWSNEAQATKSLTYFLSKAIENAYFIYKVHDLP